MSEQTPLIALERICAGDGLAVTLRADGQYVARLWTPDARQTALIIALNNAEPGEQVAYATPGNDLVVFVSSEASE